MMQALYWGHPRETDLALFAGGELGPVARWRIEGHLNSCDHCRQAVGEFFELRSSVMDLGELPPLDWNALASRIHQRVELAQPSERAVPAWRHAWATALAILLLIGAGVYLRQYRVSAATAVLDASAGSVELRLGSGKVLTMVNTARQQTDVQWRVGADAVSARYLDKDTGNITVNHVYSE